MTPQPDVRSETASFTPQLGDLYFQELGEFEATRQPPASSQLGRGNRVVEHAAIFVPNTDGLPGVVEAYPPRVRWTPLQAFLARHLDRKRRPSVFVARIRAESRQLIPAATEFATSRIGRPFDEWYDEGDDAYYCSELIVAAFEQANAGVAFFTTAPMSFAETARSSPSASWERHFARLGRPVPLGRPGSNPGSLSRSPHLQIVHAYGQLHAMRQTHGSEPTLHAALATKGRR